MTELEKQIVEAAQLYYTNGTSPLSDEEFDAMVELLRKQNPNSELFKTGWGYDVQKDTTPGKKYPHIYTEAGSLDKVHNYKELGPSLQKESMLDASLKIDGLSTVIYYREDEMLRGLTRGNGKIGIDITDKLIKINPDLSRIRSSSLSKQFTGAVRGEIVMTQKNFEIYKQRHPEAKNARNSAAGLINSNEISEDLELLDVILYTIVANEDDDRDNFTATQMRDQLDLMFGKNITAFHGTIHVTDEQSLQEEMKRRRDMWYGIYPADGIVLTKINIPVVQGEHNSHYELEAKAFKFPPELKATKVKHIKWKMSKTRYAVPRVILEPIELAGTTVQAATGFNAKFINDNRIAPGAIVEVSKRGEIIPYVERVIEPVILPEDETYLPEVCPCCGADLEWDGVQLLCPNNNCTNASEQDLILWMNSIAPLDNLGDTLRMKFINEMIDAGMITEATIEEIMDSAIVMPEEGRGAHLDLFGKMWNAIHSNPVPLASALKAVNIPRLGDITSDKLAQYPEVVKDLVYNTSGMMSLNQIVNLGKLIGSANAKAINENMDKLRRIKLLGDRVDWSKHEAESKGKVAITGTLSVKRSVFEAELKAAGFTPGDLKKDTKFLITDNPGSGSSKNVQADKWGIPKLTEAQFREQYLK